MNYRHLFHAGNFADVAKHALLVRLVRSLQRKPKPFLYLDTHAGRGAYDLAAEASGDTLVRTPEWPDGIGRVWTGVDVPGPVADYVDLVRRFDRARGNLQRKPRFYPGSSRLVAMLARPGDRLALYEMHAAECNALRDEFSVRGVLELPLADQPGSAPATRSVRVGIQQADGYMGVRALLPPPERRALVLVDPSYEAEGEFARVASGLADGLKRLPSAVFGLWYPLTERARIQEFFTAVVALGPPPTLVVELSVASDASARKMKGCGFLVVNPPWRFDEEAKIIVGFLAAALAQEDGASGRVSWLVPDA